MTTPRWVLIRLSWKTLPVCIQEAALCVPLEPSPESNVAAPDQDAGMGEPLVDAQCTIELGMSMPE